MYISLDTVATLLSILSVGAGLIALFVAAIKRKAKEEAALQEIREDLEAEKEHTVTVRQSCHKEQMLIINGLLACLKGLKEQGCNGPVTIAINEIEKYINQKAHEE